MAWREQADGRLVLYDENDNLVIQVGDDASLYNKAGTQILSGSGSPSFNVKDAQFAGGAKGDGTTDDTAAIQACYVAAALANAKVYFPATTTFYKLTDTILVTRVGQVTEGVNGRYTEIKQTVAAKDAFHIAEDLVSDPFTSSKKQKQMLFRNLRVTGVGYATSTGAGFRLVGPVSGTWSGDAIYFDNVDVLGFQWGYYIDSFGNVRIADTCTTHYNDTNIYCVQSAGQSNNSHYLGGQNVFAQTVGIDINAVCQGLTIACGDMGNQPKNIRFRNGGSPSTATIIGKDYESATGVEGSVDIESNWTVVAIGIRFGMVTGTDMEPFRIAASSALHIQGGNWNGGYAATTALVLALSALAEITADIPGVTNTNDTRPLVNWNGLVKTGINIILPSRTSAFEPTAAVNYKHRVLWSLGVDSGSVDDHIKAIGRKGGGVSSSYAVYRLTAFIEGTGSPESAQIGSVSDHYIDKTSGITYRKESGANTNTGWKALLSTTTALDAMTAPTDIATLNATTSAHGLLPKLSGKLTESLRGDGTFARPPELSAISAGSYETIDRMFCGGVRALTAGHIYLSRVWLPVGSYTAVDLWISTLTTTSTNAYVGVYNYSTGAMVSVTGDLSTALNSTAAGKWTATLSTTISVAGYYWLAVLVATNPPTLVCQNTTVPSSFMADTPAFALKDNTGSRTSIPDPVTAGINLGGNTLLWGRVR